ncbi:unnamed protein product, partial [Notodromas monacha]
MASEHTAFGGIGCCKEEEEEGVLLRSSVALWSVGQGRRQVWASVVRGAEPSTAGPPQGAHKQRSSAKKKKGFFCGLVLLCGASVKDDVRCGPALLPRASGGVVPVASLGFGIKEPLLGILDDRGTTGDDYYSLVKEALARVGVHLMERWIFIFNFFAGPRFRLDNTDHIIDVNRGNVPFEYDQVNIVCPSFNEGAPGAHSAEKYVIYLVSKEEYDTCRITNPKPRIIAVCDRPDRLLYFTITFRSFTPQPGGLEFRPGHDYYFISTSSREDLHRRVGGHCKSHNMKVVFKVCCKSEDGNDDEIE